MSPNFLLQTLRGRYLSLRYGYGQRLRVGSGVQIRRPASVKIGSRVILSDHVVICPGAILEDDIYVGPYSFIDEDTHIESGVSISTHCSLLTRSHDSSNPGQRAGRIIMEERLTICRGAWIGTYALVLSRVGRVGSGAIVGAGSVVTRPVGANSIVAGNPARQIRLLEEQAPGSGAV